ncbi:MAG: universal stress protein [Hyphomicrobium sp.]
MLARIAHTTDFSAQSMAAFRHALRLSLANRCRLDLLHVKEEGADDAWDSFPHVREVLAEWGLMDARGSPADIESKLGVRVAKIEIKDRDVVDGISQFFLTHRPDLLVVATHGRRGVNRWLNGSVSEDVARRTHVPTLLIGPDGHGFIDARSGDMSLRRILVPVTPMPSPARVIERLASLLSAAEVTPECFELMHVVERAGPADDVGAPANVDYFEGPVVETILRMADERNVDLIAMPTARHHGLTDAFRGSTTSRVIAQSRCAVLTLPLVAAGP